MSHVKWVLALTLALTPSFAQSSDPPGTIDGSVDPELIPDVVAFRLFLGALVEGPGTPAAQSAGTQSQPLQPSTKQRAKLTASALNAADMSALLQALDLWQTSITPSATNLASAIDLDAITEGTMGALQQKMTPAGYNSLLVQVRSEKKHMKRVPVPNMGQ